MSGYTPLFSSIVTSSIWQEDNATRLLWVTLLALADASGKIEGSIPGIANIANIPLEECKAALKKLESPDPYSRTKENEGRRIHEIDGGWQIYNYKKFRDKAKSRAEYYKNWRKKNILKEKTKQTKQTKTNNINNATLAQHSATVAQQKKKKYLDYVFLTNDEHKKLIDKFGLEGAQERIENLNDAIGSKGYKYKSHYHTILSWDRKDNGSKTNNRDYSRQRSSVGTTIEM